MAPQRKVVELLPISREKLTAYLNARIEIMKKQMHDYVKSHDYAYALKAYMAMDECKKLVAVIQGNV